MCWVFREFCPVFKLSKFERLSFNSTHSCRISASVNWVNIASDNGLSPIRHQAIIKTNAGLLSIGPLGTTNFSEILVKNRTFSFKKMRLKMSPERWRPSCSGEDELTLLLECGAAAYFDAQHSLTLILTMGKQTGNNCCPMDFIVSSVRLSHNARNIPIFCQWKYCSA